MAEPKDVRSLIRSPLFSEDGACDLTNEPPATVSKSKATTSSEANPLPSNKYHIDYIGTPQHGNASIIHLSDWHGDNE